MRITAVRVLQLHGEMALEGELWEDRQVRPLDIYDSHRATGKPRLTEVAPGRYRTSSVFVRVETDEGVSGTGGPITPDVGYIVARQLAPLLTDEDPRATERLWDVLYRSQVHGRRGSTVLAISAVDCALWDLKGKWLGQPVYRLLGGPTRERLPVYVSTAGCSTEPERAAVRARELAAQGYRAQKWFMRHGPGSGREGVAHTVALVRAVREAVGPEVDVMLDSWMSWDLPFAVEVGRRIAEYRPRWLEEPALPDKLDTYVQIRRALAPLGIPVSGGEHEYTRWGLKAWLDAGALDLLQPDLLWCGGLSELVRICTMASLYDLPVVPHGQSVPATCHLVAAMPPDLCPLVEYLVNHNVGYQWFLEHPVRPVDGWIDVATLDRPGLGIEIDPAKVTEQRELTFG